MESADELSQPTVVHAEPSPETGDERRGTILDTPYDSGFVGELKARWKHGQRYWSPESETWWIEAGHEEACEELVVEHFGGAREAAGEWWVVFGLYLATGMRASELLALQRRDVDLSSGWIVVESGKSAKSRREVPVGGEALASLRGWVVSQDLDSSDPLFPNIDYSAVRRAWADIREEAGLGEDIKIHGLRHTYAVHMARAGMPLIELKRRLGHADITTTMRYAEYRPSERTRAYDEGLRKMGISREDHTLGPTPEEAGEDGDGQDHLGVGGNP